MDIRKQKIWGDDGRRVGGVIRYGSTSPETHEHAEKTRRTVWRTHTR